MILKLHEKATSILTLQLFDIIKYQVLYLIRSNKYIVLDTSNMIHAYCYDTWIDIVTCIINRCINSHLRIVRSFRSYVLNNINQDLNKFGLLRRILKLIILYMYYIKTNIINYNETNHS